MSRLEDFVERFVDLAAGGVLNQLARDIRQGTLIHLRAFERATDGNLQGLAFEAGEEWVFGDPVVLDGDLERERDGFIGEADGALRAHGYVADLEFDVLVIDAAIGDFEINLLIANRKERGGLVRLARRCA